MKEPAPELHLWDVSEWEKQHQHDAQLSKEIPETEEWWREKKTEHA